MKKTAGLRRKLVTQASASAFPPWGRPSFFVVCLAAKQPAKSIFWPVVEGAPSWCFSTTDQPVLFLSDRLQRSTTPVRSGGGCASRKHTYIRIRVSGESVSVALRLFFQGCRAAEQRLGRPDKLSPHTGREPLLWDHACAATAHERATMKARYPQAAMLLLSGSFTKERRLSFAQCRKSL
jgi:hypothetical protein